MSFEKYKNLGITGLANLGNTCYLNSCIQILSHTYEINNLLEEISFETKVNKISDSVILIEWNKLNKLMWSENCTIAPYGFFKTIQEIARIKKKDLFTGYDQNDLPEFLIFLIESFHNSLQREVNIEITGSVKNNTDKLANQCYKMIQNLYSKDYSEFLDLFYGISVTELLSDDNVILSVIPEPFCILNLSIPDLKNPDIFDCLDLFTLKERLSGDNSWYNENTKKFQEVKKGTVFWSLPNILIIDLKRFTNINKKIQKVVSFPLKDLDLSKYIRGYNKNSYIYDLFGVCNHSGSCLGGHYTAYVKNANSKWYNFNDTIVNEVSEDKIISEKSYCLFYRKKNKL